MVGGGEVMGELQGASGTMVGRVWFDYFDRGFNIKGWIELSL